MRLMLMAQELPFSIIYIHIFPLTWMNKSSKSLDKKKELIYR